MRWSNKTIEEAIKEAKYNHKIFVVYVEDDTREVPFDHVVSSTQISELLSRNEFVAIRVGSSSQSYSDFRAIYHLVPVPSLFFIRSDGWPLEIITGELQRHEVLQRIENILGQIGQPHQNTSTSEAAAASASSSSCLSTSAPRSAAESQQDVMDSTSSDVLTSATTRVLANPSVPSVASSDSFVGSGRIAAETSTTTSTSSVSDTIVPHSLQRISSDGSQFGMQMHTSSSESIRAPSSLSSEEVSSMTLLSNSSNVSSISMRNSSLMPTTAVDVAVVPPVDSVSMPSERSLATALTLCPEEDGSSSTVKDESLLSDVPSSTSDKSIESSPSADVSSGVKMSSQERSRESTSKDKDKNTSVFTVTANVRFNVAHHSPDHKELQDSARTCELSQPPGVTASVGGWMNDAMTNNRTCNPQVSQDNDLAKDVKASKCKVFSSGDLDFENESSRSAHLQFRLPDGSTHSHVFSASSTVGEVHNYVQNNIRLPFRDFVLATSYPRLEFSQEHVDTTLSALGLVPRSVILVIPGSELSRISAFGSLWTYVMWPFSTLYSLFTYFNFWLFGGRDPSLSRATQGSRSEQESRSQRLEQSRQTTNSNNTGARRRTATSSTVQRDGNVYRLSNRQEDSDDDNNTWNGNSTQQM